MTFGALSGFDTVTIFAGESRSPARNIARATFIATPLIALLYIFGTSSILAFVSPEDIDIIGPIPQALRLGLGGLGMASVIAPIAILLLLTNYLCTYVTYFSANARLPMVAGWDHLLPEWFTRLHQKYKTPVNSILFMGAVSLAASVAVLFGAGNQEAFATLQIWTWTFYGFAYLVMGFSSLCCLWSCRYSRLSTFEATGLTRSKRFAWRSARTRWDSSFTESGAAGTETPSARGFSRGEPISAALGAIRGPRGGVLGWRIWHTEEWHGVFRAVL
jgi:amino acid transporter